MTSSDLVRVVATEGKGQPHFVGNDEPPAARHAIREPRLLQHDVELLAIGRRAGVEVDHAGNLPERVTWASEMGPKP